MRDHIQFYLNGSLHTLRDFSPDTTVLSWLREQKKLTGTKEGCAEGDCGACTIVAITLDREQLTYRAVNACIQLLGTLDGQYLLTVESLKDNGILHPVQQLMVEKHGSQCGFCTPGFVMSLFAMLHTPPATNSDQPRSTQAVCDVIAGNLCRCTGYGPIIDSGLAVDTLRIEGYQDQFSALETSIREQLQAIAPATAVQINAPGSQDAHYYQPHSENELLTYLADNPDATIVNGATDVGLWITKQFRKLPKLVFPGKIASLKVLSETDETITIPCNVTYAQALPWFAEHYPDISNLIRRLGSTQVRNAGTLCGNIANGSPIGDSPPVLIALDSMLTIASAQCMRELPLEDFFISYGKQDRQPGELVHSVTVPKPREQQHVIIEKISKRFDQDITAVLMALSIDCIDPGNHAEITAVRLAFGGMAGVPMRAKAAEQALLGKAFSEAAFNDAAEKLATEFTPMTDQRASKAYRLLVAQNALRKAYWRLVAPESIPNLDSLSFLSETGEVAA